MSESATYRARMELNSWSIKLFSDCCTGTFRSGAIFASFDRYRWMVMNEICSSIGRKRRRRRRRWEYVCMLAKVTINLHLRIQFILFYIWKRRREFAVYYGESSRIWSLGGLDVECSNVFVCQRQRELVSLCLCMCMFVCLRNWNGYAPIDACAPATMTPSFWSTILLLLLLLVLLSY